ncbi:helix-turn-helix transcriptional regulator [Sphingomonas sp. VDB2]|uniref:helix-turn-helix transcriptional regulator n=1 Tax=Sphingomonas sp. VDB2 TaxID=3228751 RepID=UPI003A80C2D5
MASNPDRLLRINEVEAIVGLKRAMIYRLIQRGEFPKQYKPGGHASRWDAAEVRAWREQQRAA